MQNRAIVQAAMLMSYCRSNEGKKVVMFFGTYNKMRDVMEYLKGCLRCDEVLYKHSPKINFLNGSILSLSVPISVTGWSVHKVWIDEEIPEPLNSHLKTRERLC